MKILILLVLLLTIRSLYGQGKEIFTPLGKNFTMLNPVNITYLNSVKSKSFRYIVHNNKIENVKKYYKNKLRRSGYLIEEEEKINKNNIKLDYMKFSGFGHIITIQLSEKKKNDIDILIIVTDDDMIFDEEKFKLNNKKDNPGFDLKDIPRPAGSIRVISLLNSNEDGKENKVLQKENTCNIIYKSKLSKKRLAGFYMKNMKKNKWVPSYNENFFHNEMGYWMTFNKDNKSCLVSILYMKEFKSNVISVYYGYK